MSDDLIASFKLTGLEAELRRYEEAINRMRRKAAETVIGAGGKTGQYRVGISTEGPDMGEVIGVEAVTPIQKGRQEFLVDAAKVLKEQQRELKEQQARNRREAAARRTADALEAKNTKRLMQLHEEEARRLNDLAKARMSSKQQWLDDISAANQALIGPKNTKAMATAKMASRQQWLDDISEAQQSIYGPRKAQMHQAINTRGQWLSDLDEAAAIGGNIENQRRDFRASRDAQRKKRLQQIADLKQQRDRERSHEVMGIASAGIGLAGNAGFPLLNVAFASMSGMKYAGIAAIATAAGEGARAIMALQDSATAAAKSLGAVGISAKIAEGRYESAKAFYGVLQQGSQSRMYNERTAALTAGGGAMAQLWMFMGNVRTNLSNAFINPLNALDPLRAALLQTKNDMLNLPRTTQEARDSMYRQLNQYQARIESPDQMWQRIQTAAASPKTEERRIAEEQLRLMDEQIKALKENTAVNEIIAKSTLPAPSQMPLVGGAIQIMDIFNTFKSVLYN